MSVHTPYEACLHLRWSRLCESLSSPRALLKLLPNHLGQHPLYRREDTLVLEQLSGDAVVGLLALNDDVGQDV